jgi:ATP-binding cassette subfamily B protein
MLEGTTTLLISHRLSALQHADDIVVLSDDGRVAERGAHAELIKRGGVYASLYERQLLDADIAALGAHDEDGGAA